MASMASLTLPHSSLGPSPRRKSLANPIACSVHLNCSRCGLVPTRWNIITSRKQRMLSVVRAAVEEEESSSQKSSSGAVDTKLENATTRGTGESNSVEDRKTAARAEIQRGQNTAIITGAISVLLGVGYLVLLQLLDTRGIELIPPPPEAFDP